MPLWRLWSSDGIVPRVSSYAIRLSRNGGPEVLAYEAYEAPDPKPGEVRVSQRSVGVNYIDTYHRTGLYPIELPGGLGLEGAGVVDAVGEGVEGFSAGDRVAYCTGPRGAYANAYTLPADKVVRLPDAVSFDDAAASMLKGLTAEFLIRRTYAVKPGETVLWHAAAGGVGLLACQWLKSLGARVIGTVGSDEKAEIARAHGCDETIVYTRDDFAKRVRELTAGEGVPVVYDSVGKSTLAGSLDSLRPRGLFVSFGNASGKPDPLDLATLSQKGSLYATRPTLFTYAAKRADLLAGTEALFEVLASGAVKPVVSSRFALRDASQAHRALESRSTVGSLLLTP